MDRLSNVLKCIELEQWINVKAVSYCIQVDFITNTYLKSDLDLANATTGVSKSEVEVIHVMHGRGGVTASDSVSHFIKVL